jgi:hypothetical protein
MRHMAWPGAATATNGNQGRQGSAGLTVAKAGSSTSCGDH